MVIRRVLSPQRPSVVGLAASLAISASLAWMIHKHFYDHNRDTLSSILFNPSLDELLPRIAVAALFLGGGYLFIRSGSHQWLQRAALACAVLGLCAGALIGIQSEIAFAQAFPDDGASSGWAPGAARTEFLTASYFAASVQALLGFAASTALLLIGVVRRPAQP
jgi:hypothetical protein